MDVVALLIFIAAVIAVTVVPVMIAARWARARRSGFVAALGAVVLATVLAQAALQLVPHPLAALAVALVVGCAAYAGVLGVSFVGAVGIAVVAFVLQLLILAGLLALGLQLPAPAPTLVTV